MATGKVNVGGGSKVKFVKITGGKVAPTPTDKFEIWVDTDVKLKEIMMVKEVPQLDNPGDTCFKTISSSVLAKGPFNKGELTIELDVPTTIDGKVKVLETTFFDYYSRVEVVYINVGDSVKTVSAYYWDGAEWVQFSFADSHILLATYNTKNLGVGETILLNPTTLKVTKRVSNLINYPRNKLIPFTERGVFFTTNDSVKKVTKYDFGLNAIEEYVSPLVNYEVGAVDIDNGWFFVGSGNSVKKYRMDDGVLLKTLYFNNDSSNDTWHVRTISAHDKLNKLVTSFRYNTFGYLSIIDTNTFTYQDFRSELYYSWVFDKDNLHMWAISVTRNDQHIIKVNLSTLKIVRTIVVSDIKLDISSKGFTMDNDGNFYVIDTSNGRNLVKLNQSGTILWKYSITVGLHDALLTDPTGDVWVYSQNYTGDLLKVRDGVTVARIPLSTLSPTIGENTRINDAITTDSEAYNPLY